MAYPVWHDALQQNQWPLAGSTLTYTVGYDVLMRPIGLTDQNQSALVSGVTYNGPSGQMDAMSYGGYNETFGYNARGQLTDLHATGDNLLEVHLQYVFPSAPNNDGRITQMEDLVAPEEVNYQYDSLGRLTLAETTGSQWGQSFTYDGFGNLTSEAAVQDKGPAPTVNRIYDQTTNRLLPTTDYTYDANGNLTVMPGMALTYNVENRLVQATTNLNGTEHYGYGLDGLRVWKQGPDGIIHVLYNGSGGKPLADFYFDTGNNGVRGGAPMVYFAGKRVDNRSVEDRLGTGVVEGGTNRMAYFPYGEQRSGTATEVQFATYKRDSATNLDYAHQRYYSSQIGRFTTPDPKAGSAHSETPQSWNRYVYASGDPANNSDPSGLEHLEEDGDGYWHSVGDWNGEIGSNGLVWNSGTGNWGFAGFGSAAQTGDNTGQATATADPVEVDTTSVEVTITYVDIVDPGFGYLGQAGAIFSGVGQNMPNIPNWDICGGGGFTYRGSEGSILVVKGFVGQIDEWDSTDGYSRGLLVEVAAGEGGNAGGGAIITNDGGRPSFEYLGFAGATADAGVASVSGGLLGFHKPNGPSGMGNYLEGSAFGGAFGVGGFLDTSTNGCNSTPAPARAPAPPRHLPRGAE
jgi:RHS repeat-associated protein